MVARRKENVLGKEDKLDRNILDYESELGQGAAPEMEEIVTLEPQFLRLVAGGDVGSGLIKIPK